MCAREATLYSMSDVSPYRPLVVCHIAPWSRRTSGTPCVGSRPTVAVRRAMRPLAGPEPPTGLWALHGLLHTSWGQHEAPFEAYETRAANHLVRERVCEKSV